VTRAAPPSGASLAQRNLGACSWFRRTRIEVCDFGILQHAILVQDFSFLLHGA
jgi:hypothetical protein